MNTFEIANEIASAIVAGKSQQEVEAIRMSFPLVAFSACTAQYQLALTLLEDRGFDGDCSWIHSQIELFALMDTVFSELDKADRSDEKFWKDDQEVTLLILGCMNGVNPNLQGTAILSLSKIFKVCYPQLAVIVLQAWFEIASYWGQSSELKARIEERLKGIEPNLQVLLIGSLLARLNDQGHKQRACEAGEAWFDLSQRWDHPDQLRNQILYRLEGGALDDQHFVIAHFCVALDESNRTKYAISVYENWIGIHHLWNKESEFISQIRQQIDRLSCVQKFQCIHRFCGYLSKERRDLDAITFRDTASEIREPYDHHHSLVKERVSQLSSTSDKAFKWLFIINWSYELHQVDRNVDAYLLFKCWFDLPIHCEQAIEFSTNQNRLYEVDTRLQARVVNNFCDTLNSQNAFEGCRRFLQDWFGISEHFGDPHERKTRVESRFTAVEPELQANIALIFARACCAQQDSMSVAKFFEAWFDLSEHWGCAAELTDRVHARLHGLDFYQQYDLAGYFANSLFDEEKFKKGANLLEAWFDISTGWYYARESFKRINRRGSGSNPESLAVLVLKFGHALTAQERFGDSANLYESWFETFFVWDQPDMVRTLIIDRLEGLNARLQAMLMLEFGRVLMGCDRSKDAALLFETWIAISSIWDAPNELMNQISSRMHDVDSQVQSDIANTFGHALIRNRRHEECVSFFEAWFRISNVSDDQGDIKATITERLHSVDPMSQANSILHYCLALNVLERFKPAASIFEAWFDVSDFCRPGSDLEIRIQKRLQGVSPELEALILNKFCTSLNSLGRHDDCVRLLACWFEIDDAWNNFDELQARLESKLNQSDFGIQVGIVGNLVNSLLSCQRFHEAHRLTCCFLQLDFSLMSDEEMGHALDKVNIDGNERLFFRLVVDFVAALFCDKQSDEAIGIVSQKFGLSFNERFWWQSNVIEEHCPAVHLAVIAYYCLKVLPRDMAKDQLLHVADHASWAFDMYSTTREQLGFHVVFDELFQLADEHMSDTSLATTFFRQRILNVFFREQLLQVVFTRPNNNFVLDVVRKEGSISSKRCFKG